MLMPCQTACAKPKETRKRKTKEDQRMFEETIPTSKKLSRKKICNSKVNDSQLLSGKSRLKAATFQKLTIRVLSKEIRIYEQ